MKKILIPFILLILIGVALAVRSNTPNQIRTSLLVPVEDTSGFARAEGPLTITFPDDHGPHPEYLTEWWYYTGNLDTADGQHFGFQLTFFRRALTPAEDRASDRTSNWAADQVYLAHFALTDANGKQFHNSERFSRGSANLAGAQAVPYRVWLDNWTVEEILKGDTHFENECHLLPCYRLFAEQGNVQLNLILSNLKGNILQGDQGYSQKGPEPGNASYYISQTRLQAAGTIQTERGQFDVSGLAWMDHEYSTSALSDGQIGWDWFSVQLSDQTELMFFQLRRDDGTIDPFSSGTVIYPDGSTRQLSQGDFSITVQDTWRSPHSDAEYPARWQVNIPSENLTLEIEPWLADQELQVSVVYWEGAVRLTGTHDGQVITGNGYVEMTGYAEEFDGEF